MLPRVRFRPCFLLQLLTFPRLRCGKEVAGLTYRLRRHADACAKLCALNLWRTPVAQQQHILGDMQRRTTAFETLVVQQLARMMYATNLPFRSLQNPEMVKFLNMAFPAGH